MKEDKDKKSMHKKWKDGEISLKEYRNWCAIPKEKSMYKKWKDGEITWKEYYDELAKKQGYKNSTDYNTQQSHKAGRCMPMSENKDCGAYLGIHIAERYLANIFENVTRMPNDNHGYDFICGKGLKIDSKSSCLHGNRKNKIWIFHSRNNKIAEYFICLGFDTIENLNPIHIWLIKNTEEFKNKKAICITNSPKSLDKWQKYEQTEKLNKLIICLNKKRTA